MSAYEYWRVQVEFTAGVWTDVTADVDGTVRSTNGATAETTGEAASFSLVLRNVGFRYTPGNTSSATALATGMRIRFFEVILDQYIYHFTGFIEFPEVESVNLSMTQDQTIAISAVDQLTAWERSATCVSTLTEYIRYTGGSALKAWWTLSDVDADGSGRSEISGVGPLIQVTNYNDVPQVDQLVWAGRAGPVGDDASYVQFAPTAAVVASEYLGAPRLARRDFTVALTAGESVAVMGWIYVPTDPNKLGGPGQVLNCHGSSFGDPTFYLSVNSASWQGIVSTNAGLRTLFLPSYKLDGWTFVALILDVTSGAVTFCVDSLTTSGSVGGASTGSLGEIALDGAVATGLAWGQVQIWAGAGITSATALAQFSAGYSGLERQTTGDRIKTLARYAGLTDGQLTKVDTGCSIMQTATLAGQTIAAAMYDARDTEQGDLFIDGAGLLTFRDRRTILNI